MRVGFVFSAFVAIALSACGGASSTDSNGNAIGGSGFDLHLNVVQAPQPVYRCLTNYGACPLRASSPGALCGCPTPYGVVQGQAG